MLLVPAESLKELTTEVLRACGAPQAEARIVADHLVAANLRGYDTHGVIRIPQYLDDVRKGVIIPGAPIHVCTETGTTAVVDCGWNFGQVGGLRSMDIAIDKARKQNVSMVVARKSNHAGRLGTYTQHAAEQGLFAFAVCNSPIHGHFVLPWGGSQGRLATNPISYAIPGDGEGPILADFSTAETSEGAIRLHQNQGTTVPPGWIVDAVGEPTRDPANFYGPPRGSILPFGGSKGYRGYALSVMVEVLGGLLAGSSTTMQQPGNGLAFIVVNTEAFLPADEFQSLLREMRDYIKSSPPANGHDEVYLPGEPDLRKSAQRLREGIPIDQKTWTQICSAAQSVGVDFDPTNKVGPRL
jgi:uncharacterized oxidoreductase